MPASPGLAERSHGTKNMEQRSKNEGGGLERVTVNLTNRSARALELATELTGDSKTDIFNRAIQVYAYLEYVIGNGGTVLTKKSEDSETVQLQFF